MRKFNDKEKKLARLALKIFIYDIQRYITSYSGFCKNINAVVFSGAIGSHSEVVRNLILKDINFRKRPKVLICETDEEKLMASEIVKL
jgi:acetate kinase